MGKLILRSMNGKIDILLNSMIAMNIKVESLKGSVEYRESITIKIR